MIVDAFGVWKLLINRYKQLVSTPTTTFSDIIIMLGVEGYGSDAESGDERTPSPPPTKPQSSLLSKLPPPTKKSSLSLPPPASSSSGTKLASSSSTGPALSAPKSKKPKKITIGLPSLPDDEEANDDIDNRPAKKPRLGTGAGSSGLLSMLPAPKNKVPIPAAPERVLGGGRGPGLVFHTGSSRSTQRTTVEDVEDEEDQAESSNVPPSGTSILEEVKADKPSIPFLPPSLVKGRANVSVEEERPRPRVIPKPSPAPAVDFFSLSKILKPPVICTLFLNIILGSSSSSLPSLSSTKSSDTPSSVPSLSSAPQVEEFTPPEPKPDDPYPGYYLLPSGSWAAYDSTYYQKFYNRWKKDYEAHVRALEKGIEKGFEAVEKEGAHEVNALKEMEKAREEIQVREERKALTNGSGDAPAAPKMNIKVRRTQL